MSLARLSVAAALLLGNIAVWGQEYATSAERMKRLSDFVGTWEFKGTIQAPPELSGEGMTGTVKVFWTLNKSALEFRAEGKGTSSGASRLKAMGILQFDSAAIYANRAYTAFFTMESDGRMLPLRGNFSGKSLVMKGTPLGSGGVPLQVTVSGTRQKTIQVLWSTGKGNEPVVEFVLTKR